MATVTQFVNNAILKKIEQGDTMDVNLDLGFSVFLHKKRCRLAGIDTPDTNQVTR
mgnify:CR=1 FL=1